VVQVAHLDGIQIDVLVNELIPGCGCKEGGSVIDDKALSFPVM